MDAVQQFAEKMGLAVPETFVVGGASKVDPCSSFLLEPYALLMSGVVGQVSDRCD